MADYQLYCFAQSGNAYKAALMLELIGADWQPILVDFFKGETRTPEYRTGVNEMGEVPVLLHGAKKLTQSGAILTYLADKSGRFGGADADERLEVLRWILFDNHKVTSFLATYRYFTAFAKPLDQGAMDFLRGRIKGGLGILAKHLEARRFVVGDQPTIADFSLCGYLFYPPEQFGFDIAAEHPALGPWLDRIKALPGWKHPHDLMPGHPLATS
ncbi:MAG TPA: glutathione S-transferase [Xanthobacteraceae bacterium]|jgi:glutathione S-transferase